MNISSSFFNPFIYLFSIAGAQFYAWLPGIVWNLPGDRYLGKEEKEKNAAYIFLLYYFGDFFCQVLSK